MSHLNFVLLFAALLCLGCGTPTSASDDGGGSRSSVDAGTGSTPDSGSEPADAGASATDSGTPMDTGAVVADSGPTTPDAGVQVPDAGTEPVLEATICSIYESQILAGCSNGYCHASGAGGFRLNHDSAQDLYDSIVNVETSARLYYVVPENDRMSYLINKLDGTQDQLVQGAGERMPPAGPYLSFEQIEVLRQWINEGASPDCP